ncbi:hypothetical protein BJX66DRAFT_338382 [Aspergillus keveii]|uniref:Uncharacterized protein n=1 Tax=Aspergillus keveii TaxID=714993 RepID=A0ABR4G4M1_9EURO
MSAPAPPAEGSSNGGGNNNTTPEKPPHSQPQSQEKEKEKEEEKQKEKGKEKEKEKEPGKDKDKDPEEEGKTEASGPPETCTNETCLTLQTFCKTCLQTARNINSAIPLPKSSTQQEIQAWVWKQISRLHLFYPTRDDRRNELRGEHKHPRVRICAVERVKDVSEGGGDFADFNDITTPHSGMLSVQECSWQDTTKSFITYSSPFVGASIGSEEAQERRMARAKMPWWAKTRARTAEREVLMLVDFPEEVKEGDEVFKLFLDGFGKRVEVVEVKFPGADSTWNAHQLAWWVYTHPAQNGDAGFSAATLKEQGARRRRRRRSKSRRQSESQPQQTYTQQQPQQQPQQQQWQWVLQQPQQLWYQVTTPVAWVTPISVDPNYSTAPAVETERIPTAREARRMQTKTPRWMKNIKFKP